MFWQIMKYLLDLFPAICTIQLLFSSSLAVCDRLISIPIYRLCVTVQLRVSRLITQKITVSLGIHIDFAAVEKVA